LLGAHLRRFAGSLDARRLALVWVEEWVGGLLRGLPSLLGLVLRFALYRCLFAGLDGFCLIYPGARVSHAYGIRAGRGLAVNSGAFLDGRGGLTLGANVLVGPNAVVLSTRHRFDDPGLPIVAQGVELAPTSIGDDVWIGANAVVLAGVRVASGTVVAAGAVVAADTDPWSIVGGVPARAIGVRPRPDAAPAAEGQARRAETRT
jgi:acetyltransferase-like isoleucine patch superfamily enzyme